jgi:hypothetical protein
VLAARASTHRGLGKLVQLAPRQPIVAMIPGIVQGTLSLDCSACWVSEMWLQVSEEHRVCKHDDPTDIRGRAKAVEVPVPTTELLVHRGPVPTSRRFRSEVDPLVEYRDGCRPEHLCCSALCAVPGVARTGVRG